jgi:hypothetical protein
MFDRVDRPVTSSSADATHNLTRNGGELDRAEGYSMDWLVDETAGHP